MSALLFLLYPLCVPLLFCFHSNLTSFFYVVFLFQIGASAPDNAGLGVPVDAGGLSGMGMRCDWLGLLDGVVLQALIDTGVGVCVSAGGVGGGSVLVNTGGRGGVSVLVCAGVGVLLDALRKLGPRGDGWHRGRRRRCHQALRNGLIKLNAVILIYFEWLNDVYFGVSFEATWGF